MNTDKSTFISYRCPECGLPVLQSVNIFNLSGGNYEIKCPYCHQSTMSISLSGDAKIRIQVPCLACPNNHPYTLSSEIFFKREIFALQCSFTGMDICFIGHQKKVEKAMEENDMILESMMNEFQDFEENDHENNGNNHPAQSAFSNSIIMYEILSILKEHIENSEISCNCKKTIASNISLQVGFDNAKLICKKCNAEETFAAITERDLNEVIDLETIILK